MRKWLRVSSTDHACDVGCGDGYYTRQLLGASGYAAGIDLDQQTMAMYSWQGTNIGLVASPAETLPFKSRAFDVMIGVCAMEHFQDDMQALRELKRTLKPGGSLVFSVDSLSLPVITAQEKEIHARRHFVRNFYRVEDLSAKLQAAGLELLDHRYVVTSAFAYRLVALASNMRKGLILWFPLFYPLVWLADLIVGPRARAGFILVVRAGHAPAS
jgi:SAM-dependent methyltransferase